MTFRRDDPSGVGILVPCQRNVETINHLKEEAEALWKAEAPKSGPGAIGSAWGCVGAMFGSDEAKEVLQSRWGDHFRQIRKQGLSVVSPQGELDLVWPKAVSDEPLSIDIILATATLPEVEVPTAHMIAKAWHNQNGGYERYFLENVRHGIRTANDLEIWRYIQTWKPDWLSSAEDHEAVKILRREASGS